MERVLLAPDGTAVRYDPAKFTEQEIHAFLTADYGAAVAIKMLAGAPEVKTAPDRAAPTVVPSALARAAALPRTAREIVQAQWRAEDLAAEARQAAQMATHARVDAIVATCDAGLREGRDELRRRQLAQKRRLDTLVGEFDTFLRRQDPTYARRDAERAAERWWARRTLEIDADLAEARAARYTGTARR
ncbi:MAG TPA: hypothetical protein VII06_43145 [Chloroflexota bacterium]|jgi:hypothetical protein